MLWDVSVNDEWFKEVEMPTRARAELEGCRLFCVRYGIGIAPSRLKGLAHARLKKTNSNLLTELSKVKEGGQTND